MKKEHKKESKKAAEANARRTEDEENKDDEASVPLVTHLNNILHSTFSNLEVFINHQQ